VENGGGTLKAGIELKMFDVKTLIAGNGNQRFVLIMVLL
jgi:hypothetical protein